MLFRAGFAFFIAVALVTSTVSSAPSLQISVRMLRHANHTSLFEDELWINGEVIGLRDSPKRVSMIGFADDQGSILLTVPGLKPQILGRVRIPTVSSLIIPIVPIQLAPGIHFAYSGGPANVDRKLMLVFSDRSSVLFHTQVAKISKASPISHWPKLTPKSTKIQVGLKDSDLAELIKQCVKPRN